MKEVTDPNILAQLNGGASGMKEVTDPAILAQLNEGQPEAPAYDPAHDFKTMGRAAINFPGSVYRMGKGLYDAARHPVQTTGGIFNTVAGLANKGLDAAGLPHPSVNEGERQAAADAAIGYVKQRYGSLENFRKTFEEDPAGFLVDLGTVISGGGALAGKAGQVSKLDSLAGAGAAAMDLGASVATAPVTAPIGAVKAAKNAALRAMPDTGWASPQELYSSALKMPLSKKWIQDLPGNEISAREAATRAGLEHEILPNEFGGQRLDNLLRDINAEIFKTVKTGAGKGDTISIKEVLKRLQGTKTQFETVAPGDARAIIDSVAKEFKSLGKPEEVYLDRTEIQKYLNEAAKKVNRPSDLMPVDEAQLRKEKTYRADKSSYGEMKGPEREARKALARGIKEELAVKYPDLAKLNEKDTALIKLQEAMEKALPRIANKDRASLGFKAAGGNVRGLLLELMDQPAIKARLAIAINRAKKATSAASKNAPLSSPLVAGSRAALLAQERQAILNSGAPEEVKRRWLENLTKGRK